jgi:hypothetical protein
MPCEVYQIKWLVLVQSHLNNNYADGTASGKTKSRHPIGASKPQKNIF